MIEKFLQLCRIVEMLAYVIGAGFAIGFGLILLGAFRQGFFEWIKKNEHIK